MLRHSEQLNELAKALSAAQGVMEGASKDKVNPHFKSKYADLGSVWNAIREPLAKNGLSVVQLPYTDEQGRVYVSTMLMHQSGQWIETSYTLPATKPDAQGLGSAITYMKRYALTGMGVAPEDDDGNDASRPAPPLERQPAPLDRATTTTDRHGNGDPRLAAIKWGKEAEATIQALKTANDLRQWELKNAEAMRRLNSVDRNIHDKLCEIVNEKFMDLKSSTLQAG